MNRAARHTCPECKSEELYTTFVEATGTYGPNLLPALSGFFQRERLQAVLCRSCGLLRFFASEQACEKLQHSDHWSRVEPPDDH